MFSFSVGLKGMNISFVDLEWRSREPKMKGKVHMIAQNFLVMVRNELNDPYLPCLQGFFAVMSNT